MKNKAGKRYFHLIVIAALIIILVLGCAKSIRPPGGPEDKTPPTVFITDPATGSVEVPLDSRIVIKFSEGIDRQTAEKAVFISPLSDPEPKIKIKNDAIIIIPRGNLEPDKTYVVTVGTDLRDAHRVNLEQSISVAFSTGITIDSGSITGTVYKNGKGTPGVSLAIFEDEPGNSVVPVDSLVPGYITQSGEGGQYTFEYLPPGTFYMVAFEDKNKNHRINQVREMTGVPFTATIINSENPRLLDVDIRLNKFESPEVGLLSVSVNPDRLIKVRFSRKLDISQADSLILHAILSGDNEEAARVDIIDFTNLSPYPASDFLLMTEPLKTGMSYQILFDLQNLNQQLADSLRILTYSFTVPEGEDQSPPFLIESIPSNNDINVSPDSAFLLRFSELIDTAAMANVFRLVEAEEETSFVSITRHDMFTYEAEAVLDLKYGREYRILIDALNLRDMAGNKLSDSLVSIDFTTVGLDTMGQLSGQISFSAPEDAINPVVISFKPAGKGETKQVTLSAGQLQFVTNLLPGYYTVSAFLDRNQNNIFDYGSLVPYQLAEPFVAPVDTFRVRTRFESAGVTLEL